MVLSQSSRSVTNGGGRRCDNRPAGWYRFKLNGVDAVMPTSCVQVSVVLCLSVLSLSLSLSLLCLSLSLSLCVCLSLSLNVPSTYPSAKMTLRHPSTKPQTNWNQHIWMEPSADEAFGLETLQDVDNKSPPARQ